MKNCKRILCGAVLACLMLLLIPVQVFAAGYINTDRNVSLTVYNTYEQMQISNVEFKIYHLSTVADNGEFTPTEDFRDYAGQLNIRGKNDAAWWELAVTLERDILLGEAENVQPAAAALTDAAGKASFHDLAQGLYLVLGTRAERDGYVYSTAPLIVSLPARDTPGADWNYDVVAYAKPEKQPVLMDFEVVKVWKDEGYTQYRPNAISIQLICDGKPYGDPIKLPNDGHWTYTWKALDVNHYWTVEEARVEGYLTPEIKQEGNTFLVTNTYDEPEPSAESNLPQTGQLWWPVPVLLAAGLLFLVLGLIIRRKEQYEK